MSDNEKDQNVINMDFGEKDTFFFSLDGTLSDFRHRLELRLNDYNWDNFHEAADKDAPKNDTTLIMRMLSSDFMTIVYTTRPEKYRATTQEWLAKHKIFPDVLLMKQYRHNYAKDEVVKVTLIKELYATKTFPGGDDEVAQRSVVAIFEDDKKAAEALRNMGFTVFSGA